MDALPSSKLKLEGMSIIYKSTGKTPRPTRRYRFRKPETALLVLSYLQTVTADGVSSESKMPRHVAIFRGQTLMVNLLSIRTWGMNFPRV